MGELCLSSTSKPPQFPSLILSHFALSCSFVLSHPLYFLYFIFVSPYLLKLLSFLSPLFITTSLLLLGLDLVHDNSAPKLSEPGPSFFLSTIFQAITHRLRQKVEYENQEFHANVEEFEAYRIVFLFDTSIFDAIENPVEGNGLQAFDVASLEEKPAGEIAQVESTNSPFMEEKRIQDSLKEFENKVEEKTVDPPGAKSNKVVKEHEGKSTMRSESEAKDIINTRECDKGEEYTEKEMLHTKPLDQSVNGNVNYTWPNLGTNIGTYGSMRKEKEWRRTLACKLFEERHNAALEGDEGIDSLWEAYESKDLSESKRMVHTKKRNIRKSSKKDHYGDEIEEDDDGEEEEFEMTNGQLCCLQAFKFSAGKMNLGMGRPNLVKISKALKGINWLHHVKRHGNGKKERF